LNTLAELFQKQGYTRGLVCHGVDGLDEISNVGDTMITEFTANDLKEYIVKPEDMGIHRAQPEEIATSSTEENTKDFLRILYGVDDSPKRSLVLVNAAAGLYVMGAASDLKEGVKQAQTLIDTAKVSKKLEEYIAVCGDPGKLQEAKVSAGIN